MAYNISKELVKKGHNVSVITTDGFKRRVKKSSENLEGIKIFYLRNLSLFLASHNLCIPIISPFVLNNQIRKFDVIHLHTFRSMLALYVSYYAMKYEIPYVIQTHGSLPKKTKKAFKSLFDKMFGYRVLKNASKVIAVSKLELEQYKTMGVPEEKIAVIPNGIDLSEFANLPPNGSFKRKLGLEKNTRILLYLGRIHRIKGVDILIRAYANIVERLDNLKLVIAGPDDGYLSEIENLIRKLEIENRVLVTGPLYERDKFEAYVDAETYVLPSRYEIWGMTILEAVACGTPVILTENCGVADYLGNEVGLVTKPSIRSLSESLLEILLDDKTQQFFRDNCKTVVKKFNISTIGAEFEELYKNLVNNS